MPAKPEKSNAFTVRIKPELLTILDRYAEDHTNGNRSAAANHFLEIGLQQAGVLPKPVSMDDISALLDARLTEVQSTIIQSTDQMLGQQTTVYNEYTRQIIRDMVPVQLSETQQKLLEAGESQKEEISEAVSAAIGERLDKIEEQTKPRKSFWQRLMS